jgi:hypothetical protein
VPSVRGFLSQETCRAEAVSPQMIASSVRMASRALKDFAAGKEW